VFYLLSDRGTPLSSAERLCAFLLAWPLIFVERLGGVKDFMGRPTLEQHGVVWSAWIALWIYYYVVLMYWQRLRRRQ